MKKYLSIAIVAILMLTFFIYGAKLFSPGSYGDAERYELSVDESTLISLFQTFRDENPQYRVPAQVSLLEERIGFNKLIYRINLYYPQENQILFIWTRPAGKQKTTVAFVAINEGLILGHWRYINKDFGFFENRKEKKKFEERILNKIKEKIKE
jgi:hypothetical protein